MLAALEILLEDEGYSVTTASSGIDAIEMAKNKQFDLVISDVQMAEMDGIETLSNLKQQQPSTRSIVITGYASPDVPIQAIKMGVDDYILKPFDDRQFVASVKRCLDSFRQQKMYTEGLQQQWRDFSTIIKLLAEGVEERDEHFHGHSRRVAEASVKLGRKLGLSRNRLEALELAAFLHDIGTMGQKKAFLDKAEELLQEDLQQVQEAASQQSESLFSSVSSLREIFRIIVHHHDWFDGSAQHGLKGEDIPLESRILCVTEAYDAMISKRPHRQPLGHQEARQVLQKEAGTHFDPSLVEALLAQLVTTEEDEENEEAVEQTLSRERQAELLLGISRTYLAAGDLETANRGFNQVIELLGSDGTRTPLSEASAGLALSFLHRKRFEDAEAAAQKAVEWAQASSQLVLGRARALRGLCYGHLAKADQGLQELAAAAEIFQTWEARSDTAVGLLYQGRVERERNGSWHEPVEKAVEVIDTYGLQQVLKQERYVAIPLLLQICGMEEEHLKAKNLLAWLGWDTLQPFFAELEPGTRERAISRLSPREGTSGPQSPPLSLYGFGKFRVFLGDQEVGEKLWKTRKSKYLFAYLACQAGRDVPDEKVMDLFWPDHEPEKARQSLYAALSHMRKALEAVFPGESDRVVLARKGFYRFNADRNYFFDTVEFERLYDQGQARIKDGREDEAMVAFQKAESLYTGEFMEGYYEDWAVFIREELDMKYTEMLQTLMDHFYDKSRYPVCIDYAQRLLRLDACHQDAHMNLMRSYVAQGKPEQAARQYQTCSQVMKNELNMSPAADMTALYLSITG
jgi:putative two-component system response regulator